MAKARWWAIVASDSGDLLSYERASSSRVAIRIARKAISKEDWAAMDPYAIPADRVREDLAVPGYMVSAIEYGPEYAFGPKDSSPYEWEEYEEVVARLERAGVKPARIVDWVRIDGARDLWAPVVGR